jgi:hypothetical protein
MPLKPGASPATIGQNIREMRAAGHPEDQSVAAAEREADQARARKGRPGTMESLRGRAKASAERTGKGVKAAGRRY